MKKHLAPIVLCALAGWALAACGSSTKNSSDGGGADLAVDAIVKKGPLARVFANNPVDDKDQLTEVELAHITDPDGLLTGEFVDAYNCLNKEGGEPFAIDLGGGLKFSGRLCKLEKTVKPGDDGTYLHIEPPKWHGDANDPFAELMMYHHVTTIHDYFKDSLGVTHMDRPLRAIVNLQAYLDSLGTWMGLVNAAYVPKESASLFKDFGVNILNDEDAIVFIQGPSVDTAYDASVIYHEYTHAIIGSALQGNAPDKYGTDPTPPGLNEGLADYFAASRLDSSKLGSYALADVNAVRDLERNFKCPDHVIGESHNDGEIAAGALWAARKVIGKDLMDKVVMRAVLGFTSLTTFEEAATAILDEIKKEAPNQEAAIRTIFEERGMLGCQRLKDHVDFEPGTGLGPGYPANSAVYKDGTPAFMQYKVEVAATTKELTIEWLAEGSGGMPGLPGPPGVISVALRKGADPITYAYDQTPATSTAHAILSGEKLASGERLVISGACLTAGPLVFQFLNKSIAPGELKRIKVTQSDTVTATTPNFESCP